MVVHVSDPYKKMGPMVALNKLTFIEVRSPAARTMAFGALMSFTELIMREPRYLMPSTCLIDLLDRLACEDAYRRRVHVEINTDLDSLQWVSNQCCCRFLAM